MSTSYNPTSKTLNYPFKKTVNEFVFVFVVTMLMFQVLMMWMSLIRYCQDSRLFMSTNIVCHIICSFCRFPSSLRRVKCRLARENLGFN